VSIPRPPSSVASPASGELSISVDVEDVALSEDEAASVRLEDLDQEWPIDDEHLLLEEQRPTRVMVAWSARETAPSATATPRPAPTPRTGAPAPSPRHSPAIVPPPAAGMDVGPLPAPPAPPRPEGAISRKPAPEKGRAGPRSNQKKN
jgi:hypothetical protein